jgi:AraC-like DNA-binding protein
LIDIAADAVREEALPRAVRAEGIDASLRGQSEVTVDGRRLIRPVARSTLCGLARPLIRRAQRARQFCFHEATLLLVLSGEITLLRGARPVTSNATGAVLFIAPGTTTDVLKEMDAADGSFRSIFLTLSEPLLRSFKPSTPALLHDVERVAVDVQAIARDEDLVATILHAVQGIESETVSDTRLQFRLMELLEALVERGCRVGVSTAPDIATRLRALIAAAPERRWTAKEAGRMLAMSEATLRRRLADDDTNFENELVEVRMHHALMLLQTTSWNIPRVAEACGYLSRARFASRFRERFGFLPSSVR